MKEVKNWDSLFIHNFFAFLSPTKFRNERDTLVRSITGWRMALQKAQYFDIQCREVIIRVNRDGHILKVSQIRRRK